MPLLQWKGKTILVIETRALCAPSGFTWLLGFETTFGYFCDRTCAPKFTRIRKHTKKPTTYQRTETKAARFETAPILIATSEGPIELLGRPTRGRKLRIGGSPIGSDP